DLHSENLVLGADGEIAVIDFDDCGFGHYMLDVATVLASMYRRGRDRPGAYRRFAHRYLGGYERERALPEAFGQLEAFLIMRDMVILNFVTHSRNPTVAEWGPGRARGIVDEMRRHLDGRPYPGALTR
ncbi:MAG: hypothetical protein QOF55_566, partial [Thermoleophilaceae bacterium]|nr:hypothetical protein [Thermoleophilaceae bacterium]